MSNPRKVWRFFFILFFSVHTFYYFFCETKTLLVCGRGVVGWTVTVVDRLTDEEISVTTNDDDMTCWLVGWAATVVAFLSGVGIFVTTEDDLVDTLVEDGRRNTLVSVPCIGLLAVAEILVAVLVDGTMVWVLEVLTTCFVVTILADIEGEGNPLLK